MLFHRDSWGIIVLVFFMFIILTSVITKIIFLIIHKGKYDPFDNKVLGGLGVLMVAIIANNGWIYFLSFFIAGLLIASERFMLLLAAVFNSDRNNVHKIPSYWSEAPNRLFDQQELVEAIEESVESQPETDKTELSKPAAVKSSKTKIKKNTSSEESIVQEVKSDTKKTFESYVEKISEIEKDVIRVLRSRAEYNYSVKEHVVVNVGQETVRYDAIYVEQETNRIVGAFESKYFSSMREMNVRAYLAHRATRYFSPDFKVGFMMVFNNYDHDELDKILEHVHQFEDTNPNVFITLYQLDSSGLSPLYEKSLKTNFPTSWEKLMF